TRSHFSISERGRILLVPVSGVLFLKAEQKYVVAHTREREYLLDESLVQLEEEFPQRFLRIHRNCLIARPAVRGVARATTGEDGEAHWVILLDGLAEQLPVSRRQWPAVKEALGL
ncbi:MAG: LytTR family transcriptional regulator DNA-binding domain-containing protein, partial [Zoogloea sp.]|nr:LytTR family transcriptional regulator DNA-binding domain-containing protein [Zoogloea sp.]